MFSRLQVKRQLEAAFVSVSVCWGKAPIPLTASVRNLNHYYEVIILVSVFESSHAKWYLSFVMQVS